MKHLQYKRILCHKCLLNNTTQPTSIHQAHPPNCSSCHPPVPLNSHIFRYLSAYVRSSPLIQSVLIGGCCCLRRNRHFIEGCLKQAHTHIFMVILNITTVLPCEPDKKIRRPAKGGGSWWSRGRRRAATTKRQIPRRSGDGLYYANEWLFGLPEQTLAGNGIIESSWKWNGSIYHLSM